MAIVWKMKRVQVNTFSTVQYVRGQYLLEIFVDGLS